MRRRPLRAGSSSRAVPAAYHDEARAPRHRHPRPPPGEGRPRRGSANPACSRSTGGTATARSSSTPSSAGCSSGRRSRRRPRRSTGRSIEATAFGTRVIIETFEANGVPVDEVVACGGLAEKSPLIMQIYADVTGRPFRVSASDQTPALGSAMFGAVAAGAAAGGHATIEDAARAMARLKDQAYEPNPGEPRGLRRPLPRVRPPPRLLRPRRERRHEDAPRTACPGEGRRSRRGGGLMRLEALREELVGLHAELPRHGLVVWTGGNVSARDPETGLVAIKPSGVRYEDLTGGFDGRGRPRRRVVEGALQPSSDTASHLYIYRHRPDVNGVVHTHSRYATAFAAVGRPIPVYLTAQADEFGGEIPCAGFALDRRRGDRRAGRRGDRPVAGDPAQEPRRVHDRADRGGRGQGRGHGRGRRRDGLGGPPARDARGPPRRRRRPAPRPLHDELRPMSPTRPSSGSLDLGTSEVWFVDRQPAPVRARDARDRRASTPPRSRPRRSTPSPSIPVRVVVKPVLTDSDGSARCARRPTRRRRASG